MCIRDRSILMWGASVESVFFLGTSTLLLILPSSRPLHLRLSILIYIYTYIPLSLCKYIYIYIYIYISGSQS